MKKLCKKVMKKAWHIYRFKNMFGVKNFSDALRLSWAVNRNNSVCYWYSRGALRKGKILGFDSVGNYQIRPIDNTSNKGIYFVKPGKIIFDCRKNKKIL